MAFLAALLLFALKRCGSLSVVLRFLSLYNTWYGYSASEKVVRPFVLRHALRCTALSESVWCGDVRGVRID
jgi:hypothetical protein